MSLLKVWLTAPTVQLTSSRFSLSLLSCPEVSLEDTQWSLLTNAVILFQNEVFQFFSQCAPELDVLVVQPGGGSRHL